MVRQDSVPIVLPHFKRRGDKVFFLVSRRETARLPTPLEQKWFDAIDGTASLATLEARLPGIAQSLGDWAARGIVKILPASGPPSRGPHVVVVEPHMDDAILSIGGRLLKRSGQQRTTILSITRWSPFTSYLLGGRADFCDLKTVTELRTAESQIAARLCRGTFRAMDEGEVMVQAGVPVRPDTLPVVFKNIGAWAVFGPTEHELAALTDRLHSLLEVLAPNELWIPMGLGSHYDHVRTRQACLNVLNRSPGQFRSVHVFLYDDLPYARWFPKHSDNIAAVLKRAGAELDPGTEDIADVFDEKMDVLSVYASQLKVEKLRLVLGGEALRGGAAHPHETYREMVRPPRFVPSVSDLSYDQPSRAYLGGRLGNWLQGVMAAEHLTVLMAYPAGRWDMTLDCLTEIFPDKKISIYTLSNQILPPERSYPHITLESLSTTDHLASILKKREECGEWTMVLDGERLLPLRGCSNAASGRRASVSSPLSSATGNKQPVARARCRSDSSSAGG